MDCCGNVSDLLTITTLVRSTCGQSGCGSCTGIVSPTVKVSNGGTTTVTFSPDNGCQVFKVYVDGIDTPFSNNKIKLTNITTNHIVEPCFSGVVASTGTIISSSCSTSQCRKRVNVVAGAGCTTSEVIVDDNTCTLFSACCGTLGFSACCGTTGYPSCPVPCSQGCFNPISGLCETNCPFGKVCNGGICVDCGGNGQPPCAANNCTVTPCTSGCNKFTVLNTGTGLCQNCGGLNQKPCPSNNCPIPTCSNGCNNTLSYNINTGLCSNCPTAGTLDGCECGSSCPGGIPKCRLRYANGSCGFTYVDNVNCSDYPAVCNANYCSSTIPCPACGGLNQNCCGGSSCGSGLFCLPYGATTACQTCPAAATELSRSCSGNCNQANAVFADGFCGTYTGIVTDYGCSQGCGGGPIPCSTCNTGNVATDCNPSCGTYITPGTTIVSTNNFTTDADLAINGCCNCALGNIQAQQFIENSLPLGFTYSIGCCQTATRTSVTVVHSSAQDQNGHCISVITDTFTVS